MASFSTTQTIKKKVTFKEYVKIKYIPALENTRPIPENYYKSNGNINRITNNKQIPLLKPKPHVYQPGIRKFMTMVFR